MTFRICQKLELFAIPIPVEEILPIPPKMPVSESAGTDSVGCPIPANSVIQPAATPEQSVVLCSISRHPKWPCATSCSYSFRAVQKN